MSITINATAQAELDKPATKVIKTIRLDLGGADVFYLSTVPLATPDSFDGRLYWTLVQSAPNLSFFSGYKKKKDKFVFADVTHPIAAASKLFTTLRNNGVLFNMGLIDVVYQFPDATVPNNRIGDWGSKDTSGAPTNENPYWSGRILGEPVISNGLAQFNVHHGPVDLTQRAYRKWRGACSANYADGFTCPADPLGGYGLPKETVSGTMDAVSGTLVTDAGPDLSLLAVDDIVHAHQPGGPAIAVGKITNVNPGANQFTVDSWRFGGVPAAGWLYIAGSDFTSCDYLVASCMKRGMYGRNLTQQLYQLNNVKRRWFIGLGPIANPTFEVIVERGFANRVTERSTSTPESNQGIQGAMVPVPVGNVWLRNLQVIAFGNDGQFTYAYIPIGEGRCKDLDVNSLRMDGQAIDNDDKDDPDWRDPLVLIGFDLASGGNDSGAVTAGEITEQQRRQCLGAREAWAWASRAAIDSYENVPRMFADANGTGPSPSALSAVGFRTEPGAVISDFPKVVANVAGIAARVPIAGGWSYSYNPAVFAWEFMLNQVWGGKAIQGDIDEQSFADLDAISDALVLDTAAPTLPDVSDVVNFGPDDVLSDTTGFKNWLFIDQLLDWRYGGKELEITQAGKEQTRVMRSFYQKTTFWPKEPVFDVGPFGGGMELTDDQRFAIGTFIFLDAQLSPVPVASDTLKIHGGAPITDANQYKRFGPAQGQPAKDVDVGQAFTDILKNCFATHYQKNGSLAVSARWDKDLVAINLLPTVTDKGTPNVVIHPGGKSSIVYQPYPPEKVFNEIEVQYLNQASGDTELLVVKNQAHQEYLRTKHGASSKYVRKTKLSLNLCSREEWAIRLGALYLRHYGARPGQNDNGTVTFLKPWQQAVHWRPVEDVFPIDSDELPSWIVYVRVEDLVETFEQVLMQVNCIPYVDADYTQPLSGLEVVIPPGGRLDPENPIPLAIPSIESMSERLVIDTRGVTQAEITAEYTLPD